MSIRNHICTAKRFFQRTLDSFKSFLSKADDSSSYQRLPRTPPFKCKKTGANKKQTSPDHTQECDHDVNSNEKKSLTSYKGSCNRRRLREAAEQREARMRKVAERLKELEMVDNTNVDHLLDIDEVFHSYSRLNSPFFLEIVDKFFMEMQAEFMGAEQSLRFSQRCT